MDQPTVRRTNQQTDTPSYRVVRSRLKMESKAKIQILKCQKLFLSILVYIEIFAWKLEKSENAKQTADAKVPEAKTTEKAQPTKVASNKIDEQMPESRKEEKKSLRVDRPKLSVVGRQHSIHEDISDSRSDIAANSQINDHMINATPKVTVR